MSSPLQARSGIRTGAAVDRVVDLAADLPSVPRIRRWHLGFAELDRSKKKIKFLFANKYWEKHGRIALTTIQMTGDIVILLGLSSAVLAWQMASQPSLKKSIDWHLCLLATLIVIVAAILGFARSGVYDPLRATSLTEVLTGTARRMLEALLVATGCLLVFGVPDSPLRFWLVAWGSSSMVALIAFRLLARCAAERLIRSGRLGSRLAVVGTGEMAGRLAALLVENSGVGARFVGVFDQQPLAAGDTPCVQDLTLLDTLLAEDKVDEIVVAVPTSKTARIAQLIHRFQPFAVAIRTVVPQEFRYFCRRGNVEYGGVHTLLVFRKPLDEAGSVIKWLEDKVLAALCLSTALPLMLLIALAIKLDSPGPVLFRQERLGLNRRPFDLLKFRSMYADQGDPLGRESARPGDRRVTRVGRVLRSTSLDELPQLINVLRGEMSLVGPRPHALGSKAAGTPFDEAVDDYRLRHRVKPGITGWAQVNGWRGETTRLEQLKERVKYDLYYVNNWSLMFDFVILGRTLFTVLSRRNAV